MTTPNTPTTRDNASARPSIARTVTAAALSLGMLLSSGAAVGADQVLGGADQFKVAPGPGEDTAVPFPTDGVLFGEPPADHGQYLAIGRDAAQRNETIDPAILAEYEVGSGFVRFIDEGDSVATVIKGDKRTFRAAAEADTLGELFEAVAPPRTRMPAPIAEAEHEPIDALAGLSRSQGFSLENELIVGEDDWANGCDDQEFNSWESSFGAWHGFIFGNGTFSLSEHYVGGASVPNQYGYFGTMDEIWFGVCMVEGIVAAVDMERRIYSTGFPDGEGGFEYGAWAPIAGTDALIGPGERYLYHNHSHYGPLRRSRLDSIGNANVTGWEYFISGAATDTFAPDDQYKN